MLLDMNPKRMYDEARLLANAGVNMIANEDMPSPPRGCYGNLRQVWTTDVGGVFPVLD